MRITLIQPAIGHRIGEAYIRSWQMEPLPIATLAGLTPSNVDLRFYDDRLEQIPFDEATDAVAIPVETYTANRAYQIASEYRRRGVPVVMGGFHPTLVPDEVARYAEAIVLGEAEAVWLEVIDDLRHRTDGHMDVDAVRAGAILICPVKVAGGGVYLGDMHAMQGDGEIAGHTTDVSGKATLRVSVLKGLGNDGPILLMRPDDLPPLARPLSAEERAAAERLARGWGLDGIEESAPISFIGSGANLNAATDNGLRRAADLLGMSVDEVQNRVTITGAVEIGRHPGVVTVTLLAPLAKLDELGLGDLTREQYGLK